MSDGGMLLSAVGCPFSDERDNQTVRRLPPAGHRHTERSGGYRYMTKVIRIWVNTSRKGDQTLEVRHRQQTAECQMVRHQTIRLSDCQTGIVPGSRIAKPNDIGP